MDPNSKIQGYNVYPMLHFHRKFSSSVTMVLMKLVLRERLLEVENVEKDSGQDIQLEVAQKLYLAGYILHKTSSPGLSSSFPVQKLRILR